MLFQLWSHADQVLEISNTLFLFCCIKFPRNVKKMESCDAMSDCDCFLIHFVIHYICTLTYKWGHISIVLTTILCDQYKSGRKEAPSCYTVRWVGKGQISCTDTFTTSFRSHQSCTSCISRLTDALQTRSLASYSFFRHIRPSGFLRRFTLLPNRSLSTSNGLKTQPLGRS